MSNECSICEGSGRMPETEGQEYCRYCQGSGKDMSVPLGKRSKKAIPRTSKCEGCGSQILGATPAKSCNNCDPVIAKLIEEVGGMTITEADEYLMQNYSARLQR